VNKTDLTDFAMILAGLGEVFGEAVSPVRARLYFEALSGLTLNQVRRASEAMVRGSRFFPKPADFLEAASHVEDGHLGPEQAWALVAALREDDSVVWTDAIAEAFGVARSLLSVRDHVAARKAFLEVYPGKVAAARRTGKGPVWWASLGYDRSGRVAALREAVEFGRLPATVARGMLAPHEGRDSPAPLPGHGTGAGRPAPDPLSPPVRR